MLISNCTEEMLFGQFLLAIDRPQNKKVKLTLLVSKDTLGVRGVLAQCVQKNLHDA